jgi:hypothetical protein
MWKITASSSPDGCWHERFRSFTDFLSIGFFFYFASYLVFHLIAIGNMGWEAKIPVHYIGTGSLQANAISSTLENV